MKIKNLSLGLCLATALIGLSLESCSKKKSGYTVKVTINDANTAKVWRDTSVIKTEGGNKIYWGWVKDSLMSASDSNTNGAKLSSVKVSYTDENGKKIEDNNNNLDNAEFTKVFQVPNGRIITVTADGCVGGFAILKDTASLGKADAAVKKEATEIFEFSDESLAERKGLKDAMKENTSNGLNKKFFAKLKDKNATKPRATMKIEILKDGIVVGTTNVSSDGKGEAKGSAVAYTINEK